MDGHASLYAYIAYHSGHSGHIVSKMYEHYSKLFVGDHTTKD